VSTELIREDEGGVARLWLKRPAKRNAISESLFIELCDILCDIAHDDGTRLVLLGSAVPGVFCAGADLRTMADPDPAELERQFGLLLACLDAFRTCAKPILTVIRGDCLGVGCALAAVSDIAIAEAGVRFALPEIRLGLAPVLAMAALAPVVDQRQLLYWSASGCLFSAAQAQQAGLLTSVLAADELEAFVAQLAGDLARADGSALALVKATARNVYPAAPAAMDGVLMRDMLATATGPAARSAIEGFLQKKHPSRVAPSNERHGVR
jgi:enoyl-CoA hydratase/carnithine racemase